MQTKTQLFITTKQVNVLGLNHEASVVNLIVFYVTFCVLCSYRTLGGGSLIFARFA